MKWNNARVVLVILYLIAEGWLSAECYYNPLVWGQGPAVAYPYVEFFWSVFTTIGLAGLFYWFYFEWDKS